MPYGIPYGIALDLCNIDKNKHILIRIRVTTSSYIKIERLPITHSCYSNFDSRDYKYSL